MAGGPPQRDENLVSFSLLYFSAFSALSAVKLFLVFIGEQATC